MKDARIVVCGDASVGKSTLIASLVKGEYVSHLQNVLAPITISQEDYSDSLIDLNPDGTGVGAERRLSRYLPSTTTITDTTASDTAKLVRELKRADVICLVYGDHYSYERISLHWMPYFRSLGVNLPVVVAANKADLLEASDIATSNSDEFIPLIGEFKEIEACVRVSAKAGANVVELFYMCQRALTHPTSPLFDSKEGNLKPAAVSALKRVFFLCDQDQDGYLNYNEWADLHLRAFERRSTEAQFQAVLHTIGKTLIDTDPKKGIPEDGFIILNKTYAQKGRHETVWGILRAFNYTDSLSLNDKFLFPRFDVNPKSSVELAPTGYRFFVDLFVKFDKDNDGGLNDEELAHLFYPTPGIPKLWEEGNFPNTVVTNEAGYVTLQGWLAQWNLTTFLDYKTTLQYLAYLGFVQSVKALTVTKPRKTRQRNGKFYRAPVYDRNVFNCFVLGAPKSGKTSLLEAFLRGTYSDVYAPTISPRICAKDIELRGGKQCYLILEELGELEPAILANPKQLDQCDVICYTYDSSDPNSFQYLVDLRRKYSNYLDEIPCVFVGLKADADKQQQRCDVPPENYTRDLFLDAPLHICAGWTASLNELFIQLVDAATTPRLATPGLEHESQELSDNIKHLMIAGGTLTIMTLVSVWIWGNHVRSS